MEGAEVGFAAYEDDGDVGAADGADFFYPLAGDGSAKEDRMMCGITFVVTFSRESGVSIAKAIRMT